MKASDTSSRDIYISFFMFTTDLRPADPAYTKVIIEHVKALETRGYSGVEFPIAPGDTQDHAPEVASYVRMRSAMDDAGLSHMRITTNVGATRTFDPSSPDAEQRRVALDYLKSRVDITAALGGKIMMGPIIVPYGVFPVTDFACPIWSDALQDLLAVRYCQAQPVLDELGKYAEERDVKLAIEPITHWETPGPNNLSQLISFLDGVPSRQVGVCIDSAHELLDGEGPEVFKTQVKRLAADQRLHYVQISPPGRGGVRNSWIPWRSFLEPILQVYQGPIAVEIFNAIPAFASSLRLSRRKYWIPGEDRPDLRYPDAYTIAGEAIAATRLELNKFLPETTAKADFSNSTPLMIPQPLASSTSPNPDSRVRGYYKKLDAWTYLLALEVGAKVMESLEAFQAKEHIKSASVTGVGVFSNTVLGFYKFNEDGTPAKTHSESRVTGAREVVSFIGNMTTMVAEAGKPSIAAPPHCHISLAGSDEHPLPTEGGFPVVGGHLIEAEVGVIGEFIITTYPSSVTKMPSCGFGGIVLDLANDKDAFPL
jgi:D-psicose/D-tagatose/L-ribulose 3-epimerase